MFDILIFVPISAYKLISGILCAKIGTLFNGGDRNGRKKRISGAFDPVER